VRAEQQKGGAASDAAAADASAAAAAASAEEAAAAQAAAAVAEAAAAEASAAALATLESAAVHTATTTPADGARLPLSSANATVSAEQMEPLAVVEAKRRLVEMLLGAGSESWEQLSAALAGSSETLAPLIASADAADVTWLFNQVQHGAEGRLEELQAVGGGGITESVVELLSHWKRMHAELLLKAERVDLEPLRRALAVSVREAEDRYLPPPEFADLLTSPIVMQQQVSAIESTLFEQEGERLEEMAGMLESRLATLRVLYETRGWAPRRWSW